MYVAWIEVYSRVGELYFEMLEGWARRLFGLRVLAGGAVSCASWRLGM